MIDLVVAGSIGIMLGIISGTLPGFSPSKMLLLSALFIATMDPLSMAVMYISMMVVSQYVDAIPALYFGVPGEISAIPAANESSNLHASGQVSKAIKLTSAWRFIGSFFACLLFWPLLSTALSYPQIFSVKVQVVLLLIALIGIWLTSSNKIWALGMMIAGYLLGNVGYNFNLDRNTLTFGIEELTNGIPLVSLIMGLWVTPSIFKIAYSKTNPVNINKISMTFKEIWSHWRTGIKSSIQGSIVGIVPGLSYILSSTVCYNSSLRKRPGDSLSAVIASETGSTTGLFTSLIPLFLFGIPITVSEGLIYSSMVEKGAMFAQGLFLLTNLEILIATFIIVNIVAVILSWPLAPRLMQIFTRIDVTYLRWFILTVAVATVIIIGIMEHRLMFYLLCYLSMVVVGFFLKNKEVLPLIFVFVLQENIDYSMFTLWQIIN